MTIRSLRSEFRPDGMQNQVRAGQSLARRLYLLGLGTGFTWIVYIFVGPLVILDANGLVIQDREIVSPPFEAQVASLSVRPGQMIAAGTPIGSVVSRQMLDLIADLSTRKAAAESREGQIAARLAAITATLPAAEGRAAAAKAAQATIVKAFSSGFTTRVREAEAAHDVYDAAREAESLRSEQNALRSERIAVGVNVAKLDNSLERAQASYRNGLVTSRCGGTIGARLAEPGELLSHGNVMAEVYHGAKYVVAYLPTNRMYAVWPGQKIIVTDGVNREHGRVERVEEITDRTPAEFQSNTRGIGREQVARIALDGDTQYPLLSKIEVIGRYAPSNLVRAALRAVAAELSGASASMAMSAPAPASDERFSPCGGPPALRSAQALP